MIQFLLLVEYRQAILHVRLKAAVMQEHQIDNRNLGLEEVGVELECLLVEEG